MSHRYALIACIALSAQQGFAKTITISPSYSPVERAMRATTRIVPNVNPSRIVSGIFPYTLAGAFFIYNTTEEDIAQMNPVAQFVKQVIGGVKSKSNQKFDVMPKGETWADGFEITTNISKDKKIDMTNNGVSGILKPFGSLFKLDYTGSLVTISFLGLFKDSIFDDAKAFKKWLKEQSSILQEELFGTYDIPEKTALSSQDRMRYLYYLSQTTSCRCNKTIQLDVLHDMTEGYTAEELEEAVLSYNRYNEQEVEQIATYFAGIALATKLLDPQASIHTMICPTHKNDASVENLGSIIHHSKKSSLTATTRNALMHDCMIIRAGVLAGTIRSVELSTLLINDTTERSHLKLKACHASDAHCEELCRELDQATQSLLEAHRQELEAIISLLKEQWEISNGTLEEIIEAFKDTQN